MTEENETKSHSHGFSLAVSLLVALPLLYILSIGPVALLLEKSPSGGRYLQEFYLPVIWLHNHTILQKPLEMYIRLWGVH